VLVAAVTAFATAAPALAATEAPDFEAPFPCGQEWWAETRSNHSPSWYSVDFNRYDDYRDAVLSSAPGVVKTVADLGDSSYGKYVVVDHRGGWSTLFAHLDEQWVVKGQRIDQGRFIGLLGTTGGSTGPHLHYEQRLDGVNQHAVFHGEPLEYNTEITSRNCGDVPVVGDWNGDRRTDVGVFRRTATAKFRLRAPNGTAHKVTFGTSVAEPVTGDWNGNGVTDLGFWDRTTKTFSLRNARGVVTTVDFGATKDTPITGDWNGDGRTDVGVYRPSTTMFRLRSSNGSLTRFRFGSVRSTPVTGDWDGDGRSDVGVFKARTGLWVLRKGDGSTRTMTFGGPGSMPVVGDWNGNGRTDIGVWSPDTAIYSLRVKRERVDRLKWGRAR